MTKTNQAIVLLILMSLFVVLALTGCAPEPPAAEPEAPAEEATAVEEEPWPTELTFEAGEYVNTDIGFTVQYPVEWEIKPLTENSTIVFYATSADAVPLIFVNVTEAASFEESLDIAVTAAEGSDVKIKSSADTKLQGGESATKAIFTFKHPATPPLTALDALAVGTEKDGKWVTVTVATLGLLADFDETLFSEIAHTLKFE